MSDIVQRLRAKHFLLDCEGYAAKASIYSEAADEIEQLAQANKILHGELAKWEGMDDTSQREIAQQAATIAQLRAALAKPGEKP